LFNHIYLAGCSYPPEALAAINSWGTPPRDAMYEEKMKELKDREAIMSGDKPTRYVNTMLVKLI